MIDETLMEQTEETMQRCFPGWEVTFVDGSYLEFLGGCIDANGDDIFNAGGCQILLDAIVNRRKKWTVETPETLTIYENRHHAESRPSIDEAVSALYFGPDIRRTEKCLRAFNATFSERMDSPRR